MTTFGTLFETVADRTLAHAEAVLRGETVGVTGQPPTPRQRALLRTVTGKRGARFAVAAAELARQLGCDDREVRADVSDLRKLFGVAIGSSRDQSGGGYYLITSKEELYDTVRPFLNQAKSEIATVRMMLRPHELAELCGQMNLQLDLNAAPTAKETDHAA